MADWLRVVLKQKIHWWGDDFGGAGSLPWTCMAATPERLSGGRTAHAHTFLSSDSLPHPPLGRTRACAHCRDQYRVTGARRNSRGSAAIEQVERVEPGRGIEPRTYSLRGEYLTGR